MKKYFLLFLLTSLFSTLHAQSKKVLFIGNSYTGVNNLPDLVYQAALSAGDTLDYDKHTPGGATFMAHATNATAHDKIKSDNWDHVVLQGQSQEPSFPIQQVENQTFPYAKILCDSIRTNDPCTRPVFYMTWGRKNGDQQNCASWPPVCTYEGMDSLLNLRYRMMGDDNQAFVAPVGAVWHYIRDNHPDIELYAPDGSHPSQAGSYAAACTFYAILFQENPMNITFDYTLSAADANNIRNAATIIAYNELSEWNIDAFLPEANFSVNQTDNNIEITNNSQFADTYHWDWGDGNTSTEPSPNHVYLDNGEFTVTLIATSCGFSDTIQQSVTVMINASNTTKTETFFQLYPNPVIDTLKITGPVSIRQVQLFNAEGQQVLSAPMDEKQAVNLSGMASGVYILKITTVDGAEFSQKLVKL